MCHSAQSPALPLHCSAPALWLESPGSQTEEPLAHTLVQGAVCLVGSSVPGEALKSGKEPKPKFLDKNGHQYGQKDVQG